jgi:hypothetical protein
VAHDYTYMTPRQLASAEMDLTFKVKKARARLSAAREEHERAAVDFHKNNDMLRAVKSARRREEE